MANFRILGPIEVTEGERRLEVGGRRQLALLAFLLLHANTAVSSDALRDAIWGPARHGADHRLQMAIARLRRALEPLDRTAGPRLRTVGGGYMLAVRPGELDAEVFSAGVQDGRNALEAGDAARAAELLHDTLGLWRGPPMAEVAFEEFAQAEVRRLEEFRLAAIEARVDADLQLGRHTRLVGELAALVTEEPMRERLAAQLMIALYRSGRQTDALAVYQRRRVHLAEELGLQPGPALKALQADILAQASSLDVVVTSGREVGRDTTPGEPVEALRSGSGSRLPTGVVTFCFSDIEGSSRLWETRAGEMPEALERHYELIGGVVEAYGGCLLKSMGEGDSTISVFESATQAVRAAIDATLALEDQTRPEGVAMRARFALHTGEARRRGVGYLGTTLNLVARVRAEAADGEILLSETTASLVRRDLPAGYAIVDLGVYRLNGIQRPEAIMALVGPGLATSPAAAICPYRGLLPFEPEDCHLFFGREAVVADVLARIAPGRLLAVVGASGSGKSSLLRAGVIAAVDAGELSAARRVSLITPGAEPPVDLGDGGGELLIVDQFEELYTQCRDDERRARFIEALLSHEGPVVAGLRADFYGEVTADPELAGAVAKNQVLLGPMSDDDLRRAICEPARVAGLRLDSGLVDLVLRDVGGEPGALPLMSHALRETWERRTGRSLTVDAYRASGGVSSALAQTADVVVQRTPASERPLLRGLFLRLSNVGDGVEDTRNRVPVDELIPEGSSPEAVQTLLTRLADARLVMLDQGTAELAHEVLIRRWPTLRRWLDEDRDALQLHRRLGDAARLWDDAGRDPTDLYRGARLAATVDCASADRAQLNHTERAFLNASVEEATRTERRRRLANRRLRRALAAAGVLLLAAVGLLVFALSSRHDAVTAEASAKSRAIAAEAESQLSRDPALALLLARRALAIAATPEAMLATSEALDADPLRSQLPSFGVQGCVTANYMYLLNHGRLAVDNTCDGHVVFADLAAHKIVKRMSIGDASTDMTLSPDGQTLTIASGRRLVGLDVASGRVRPLFLAPFPIAWIAHGASPYLVISDGESVALADPSTGSVRVIARGDATANAILGMLWVAPQRLLIETSGHSQGHGDLFPGVTVLDVAHGTRQRVALPVAPNHLADLAFLNMTQDHRTWFLTGAETDPYSGQEVATTWAVDARTRRIRWIARGGPGQAASVNPSPDGRLVAVGDSLGAVDVLDAQTGRRISRDAGTASISAGWMAFAPGDSTLVTVSLDGVFRTWAQGKAELRLQIPADPAVDFSPDGNHLVLVGDRGEIVDSSTGAVVRTTGGFPASSIFAACSSNCFAATPGLRRLTYLNPAAATTRIVEIDGETGRRIADIGVPRLDAQSVAPDGRIATAYVDTGRLYAQLTDPASTRTRQLEPGPSSAGCQATTPSFTPDSRLMAIVDGCIHLVVWDVRTSRVKRAVALPNLDNAAGAPGAGITATGARITPDGRYALVAIEGGGLLRIDLANDSYSQLPGTRTITRALAISPNGRFYAIGRDDGNVDVYDARTLQLVRRHAIDNPIQALAFSPNSRELAVEDTSNVLWVWDTCDVCENPTRLAQLAAQESVRTLTPSERASFGVS